jgi:hypothetical protein
MNSDFYDRMSLPDWPGSSDSLGLGADYEDFPGSSSGIRDPSSIGPMFWGDAFDASMDPTSRPPPWQVTMEPPTKPGVQPSASATSLRDANESDSGGDDGEDWGAQEDGDDRGAAGGAGGASAPRSLSASKSAAASSQRVRLTQEEAREKRLERNRLSARQSRIRKKQYLELLESRVYNLQSHLDHLRATHAACAQEELRKQKEALLEEVLPLALLAEPTAEQRVTLEGESAPLPGRNRAHLILMLPLSPTTPCPRPRCRYGPD